MQASRAELWCFWRFMQVTAIEATPSNDFVTLENTSRFEIAGQFLRAIWRLRQHGQPD